MKVRKDKVKYGLTLNGTRSFSPGKTAVQKNGRLCE